MIKAYLSYIKRSKQNIESNTFVEDFISACLSNNNHPRNESIENYRKGLLKNNHTINFTDYGAGSRKSQGNTRKVKEIAKVSGTPKKYSNLLCKISDHYDTRKVLEFGTSLGIGSLALTNSNCNTTTIEGDKEVFEFTKSAINNEHINFINDLFDNYISKDNEEYDVIFIDGNHSKEATLKYTDALQKNSHKNSIFIYDDINWSEGMQSAWQEIIKKEYFTTTIDLFKFGVCFKNTESKGHFTIKY